MERVAIISVDGHVKALRARYRDYIEKKHLPAFDDWLAPSQALPDGLNVSPELGRGLARDYWASNCYAGISPFTPEQITMDELVGKDEDQTPREGFSIGADRAMFGVDHPHFETIFPKTREMTAHLVEHPSVSEDDARKILYANAAEVYGFDLEALAPDIERVGFALS